MTSSESLLGEIQMLRDALYVIEEDLTLGPPAPDAVRDLCFAVDGVRKSVWYILQSQHSEHHQDFLTKLRLRRAIEISQEVLTDLNAGTIDPSTPGWGIYRATLAEFVNTHPGTVT